ncbi:MAG: AMP-binding protein, partial [Pseudomonadota bacterium]
MTGAHRLAFAQDYDALRAGFDWALPDRLNMATQCLGGPRDREAILDLSGPMRRVATIGDLDEMSARLAGDLLSRGVVAGDRVGVLRSQDAWCAAAHLAIWRIGAISVPLFKLFQKGALHTRISDAGCRIVVTDEPGVGLLTYLADAIVPESGLFAEPMTGLAETGPETPACLIYTSGTTGAPKGALHGHRMLTGHLLGVEMSHDFLGQRGDVL